MPRKGIIAGISWFPVFDTPTFGNEAYLKQQFGPPNAGKHKAKIDFWLRERGEANLTFFGGNHSLNLSNFYGNIVKFVKE